jgi:hypothetical protein
MRTFHAMWVVAGLSLSLTAHAQNKPLAGAGTKVEPLPRDLQIQLALSALPPHLRNDATVYTLNPDKGFEVARKGTNGFHALVVRTGDDAMQGSWPLTTYPDDILYPISFDSAGAKANLRVFLDIAEMQAKGTPPQEVKQLIQQRYKTGHYKAPDRAGLAFMLSPILRTYDNPDESSKVSTINYPHVMHYMPNVSDGDIGAVKPTPEQPSPFPQLIHHGPHGYMVQARGVAEAKTITKGYHEMLTRLCSIKKVWCLPDSTDK